MQVTTSSTKPTCGNCSHITGKCKCDLSNKPVNILLSACVFHQAVITPRHAAILDREHERRRVKREAEEHKKAERKRVRG